MNNNSITNNSITNGVVGRRSFMKQIGLAGLEHFK
jgi:hypothetical protein